MFSYNACWCLQLWGEIPCGEADCSTNWYDHAAGTKSQWQRIMASSLCRNSMRIGPTGSLPMWLILYNKLASSSLMFIFLPVPASRYVMGLVYARKLIAKNTQKHLNLENPHWIGSTFCQKTLKCTKILWTFNISSHLECDHLMSFLSFSE